MQAIFLSSNVVYLIAIFLLFVQIYRLLSCNGKYFLFLIIFSIMICDLCTIYYCSSSYCIEIMFFLYIYLLAKVVNILHNYKSSVVNFNVVNVIFKHGLPTALIIILKNHRTINWTNKQINSYASWILYLYSLKRRKLSADFFIGVSCF